MAFQHLSKLAGFVGGGVGGSLNTLKAVCTLISQASAKAYKYKTKVHGVDVYSWEIDQLIWDGERSWFALMFKR